MKFNEKSYLTKCRRASRNSTVFCSFNQEAKDTYSSLARQHNKNNVHAHKRTHNAIKAGQTDKILIIIRQGRVIRYMP